MRKILILLSFLMPFSGFLQAQKSTQNQQTAERFFELFQKDQRSQYLALCDSAVKSKLSLAKYNQYWAQTQEQFGNFKKVQSGSSEIINGTEVIHLICLFEKMSRELIITFNDKGFISGFAITVASTTSTH